MWLEREIPVDRKVGAVLSGYKRRQCGPISIVSSYSNSALASSRIDICCIIVGKRPSSGRLAFVGQPRHSVWARHGHFILFAIALDRLLNGVLRQFIIIHTRLLRFQCTQRYHLPDARSPRHGRRGDGRMRNNRQGCRQFHQTRWCNSGSLTTAVASFGSGCRDERDVSAKKMVPDFLDGGSGLSSQLTDRTLADEKLYRGTGRRVFASPVWHQGLTSRMAGGPAASSLPDRAFVKSEQREPCQQSPDSDQNPVAQSLPKMLVRHPAMRTTVLYRSFRNS